MKEKDLSGSLFRAINRLGFDGFVIVSYGGWDQWVDEYTMLMLMMLPAVQREPPGAEKADINSH